MDSEVGKVPHGRRTGVAGRVCHDARVMIDFGKPLRAQISIVPEA